MFSFLQALEDSAVPELIRRSDFLYPLLETFHILALAVLVGSAVLWDFRILGAWRKWQLETFKEVTLRSARVAFVFVVLSGLLLFSTDPAALVQNRAFQIKIVLILLAVANASLFHLRHPAGIPLREGDGRVHAHAIVSLILWSTTVAAGRWIAYL